MWFEGVYFLRAPLFYYMTNSKLICDICRIHCTYTGSYSSTEVLQFSDQGFTYDEIKLNEFKVYAAPSALGRCFIEV